MLTRKIIYLILPIFFSLNTTASPRFTETSNPLSTLHPIHLKAMPAISGQVGVGMQVPLDKYVEYANENIEADRILTLEATPESAFGCSFKTTTWKPPASKYMVWFYCRGTKAGQLDFKIRIASRKYDLSNPIYSNEETVSVNLKPYSQDAPVLKEAMQYINEVDYEKPFSFDLSQLIVKGDLTSSFSMADNSVLPDWLHINDYLLEGTPPQSAAGQKYLLTLQAYSEAGGISSNHAQIQLSVVANSDLKPVITLPEDFSLIYEAGKEYYDEKLTKYIKDISYDNSLKLVIDKVTPAINWLSVDENVAPTTLHMLVPLDSAGRTYEVRLHASNAQGGKSLPVTLPMQIGHNKELKPALTSDIDFGFLQAGYEYHYPLFDFTSPGYIAPTFKENPFTVRFVDEDSHPAWLTIEDNKLCVKEQGLRMIPREEAQTMVIIKFIIHNVPGGDSEVFTKRIWVS